MTLSIDYVRILSDHCQLENLTAQMAQILLKISFSWRI